MADRTKKTRARVKPAATRPRRSAEVQAWLEREVAEQERRYRKIVREMDALDPRRKRWIREFYQRIQTRGFNVHADIRRKVRPEEIPLVPEDKIRVVW
jgi:hypothetical protein